MNPPVELNVPLPPVLELVGGEYRVKGHRITLYHVLSAADQHWLTPEAMVFYYPSLSYDEVRQVFAFYDANRAAVDEYLRAYRAALDKQYEEGNKIDMAELRRRFAELQAAKAAGGHANGAANGVAGGVPDKQPAE